MAGAADRTRADHFLRCAFGCSRGAPAAGGCGLVMRHGTAFTTTSRTRLILHEATTVGDPAPRLGSTTRFRKIHTF